LAFASTRKLYEEFEDLDSDETNAILDRLREKAKTTRNRNFLSKM